MTIVDPAEAKGMSPWNPEAGSRQSRRDICTFETFHSFTVSANDAVVIEEGSQAPPVDDKSHPQKLKERNFIAAVSALETKDNRSLGTVNTPL